MVDQRGLFELKLLLSVKRNTWHSGTLPNVIKRFMSVIYECSLHARVFVPDRPLQPSLASKAGAHLREALFKAPGLTHKYHTRLEKLVRGKHSSLL
jgi:hypothetical protein